MRICLTKEELCQLTNKKRPSAQIRALRYLGIDYRVRADGTPLVLRSAVEGVEPGTTDRPQEPNWGAM